MESIGAGDRIPRPDRSRQGIPRGEVSVPTARPPAPDHRETLDDGPFDRDRRQPPTSMGIAATQSDTTIGSYLIDRLHAMGVDHVFGIPGDYILTLYKMLEESPIELVGMTRED